MSTPKASTLNNTMHTASGFSKMSGASNFDKVDKNRNKAVDETKNKNRFKQ